LFKCATYWMMEWSLPLPIPLRTNLRQYELFFCQLNRAIRHVQSGMIILQVIGLQVGVILGVLGRWALKHLQISNYIGGLLFYCTPFLGVLS
jgi:hypothetical protein